MTQTWVDTPTTSEAGREQAASPTLVMQRPPTRFAGVTVIVPCFNEQGVIGHTARQISEILEATKRPFELIIVNDGSTDNSKSELNACADIRGLRVIENSTNRGYGFSLKRAVRDAKYEIIAITDADGTYPNGRLSELIDMIEDVDMVVGARIGLNVNTPWLRRPPKWALRKLAGYLSETQIPDLNSGLRVMKRSLIKKFIHLLPDGFSFTTTITLSLLTHGYDVRYVPIDYYKRVGVSSIRPIRDTAMFMSLIVRTVMYFKPLKIFGPATAALLLLAGAWALLSQYMTGVVAIAPTLIISMAALQVLAIGLLADLIDKRSPQNTA